MSRNATSLFGGLGLIYRQYGGVSAVIASAYFWSSAVLAAVCWRFVQSEAWLPLSFGILPSIAGFSVAAYALIFAVLDRDALNVLAPPSADLDGRSPILMVASSISHAVIVQISALIYALVFQSKPFAFEIPNVSAKTGNLIWSGIGLLMTIYGIVLVVGATISVFRLLTIRASIPPRKDRVTPSSS